MIEARFYPQISDLLAEGACACLERAETTWDKVQVPGVFEIPAALAMALGSEEIYGQPLYDGFIVLGCVIRGETTHYDYVCSESARGINHLAMQHALALGYGILTVENLGQAIKRADPAQSNKGAVSAQACLDMIALSAKFEQ